MSILKSVPPYTGNLVPWIAGLTSYLKSLETFVVTPSPKIVQLESRKNSAKATEDGVLMWDVGAQSLVVSRGGEWFEVLLGAVPITTGGIEG